MDKKTLIRFGFCITGEDEFASVGCGEVDIEHLDGGEFFQRLAGCQSRGVSREKRFEGHLQAVSDEGYEDVAFDSIPVLMENGANVQIAFQRSEYGLHLNELQIELPQISRISIRKI